MDMSDLSRRVTALLTTPTAIGEDGSVRLHPEFETLEQDLAQARAELGDTEELVSLSQALDMMKQTASLAMTDPEVAKSLGSVSRAASEPRPEIFDAIEDGDIRRIEAALASWDINQPHGEFDCTALYHAMSCMLGTSLETIDFLLDAGADPKRGLGETNVLHGLGFANLDGIAPEDLAAVIRRCVELGADLEERSDKLKWTPLILAVSEWNPVATEALLLAGANINAKAGEVDGVCCSGSGCMDFADGHDEVLAVLSRYMPPGQPGGG